MIESPAVASVPQTSPRRRILSVGLIVAGVAMLAAVAPWLLSPGPSASPPGAAVWWRLTGEPGYPVVDGEAAAPRLDQATLGTTTEIPIVTYYPWAGTVPAPDDSWLGTPTIAYTPSAVIITLHMSTSFDCGDLNVHGCGWSLWPRYVQKPVHLSEPLGDRALFDGRTNPPQRRWFPWDRSARIDLEAVKMMYTDACHDPTVFDTKLCAQVNIQGMTAEERTLAVPTTLGPADKDRADAICDQMAFAHDQSALALVDGNPKVPAAEEFIRILDMGGARLTECSLL
jgi:hypothetical protein